MEAEKRRKKETKLTITINLDFKNQTARRVKQRCVVKRGLLSVANVSCIQLRVSFGLEIKNGDQLKP